MINFHSNSLTTAQRELRYSVGMEDRIKTSEETILLSQLNTSNMVTGQYFMTQITGVLLPSATVARDCLTGLACSQKWDDMA